MPWPALPTAPARAGVLEVTVVIRIELDAGGAAAGGAVTAPLPALAFAVVVANGASDGAFSLEHATQDIAASASARNAIRSDMGYLLRSHAVTLELCHLLTTERPSYVSPLRCQQPPLHWRGRRHHWLTLDAGLCSKQQS